MTTDAMWTDFTIESVSPATSDKGDKDQQWEVKGKYSWTPKWPVRLFKSPTGGSWPNASECPEIFKELSGKRAVDKVVKVRVARGDLTKGAQAEYDSLASEDKNVEISQKQSEYLAEAQSNERTRFKFHWYLVSPYWSEESEELEEDDKVIVTHKGGNIRIPASGADKSKITSMNLEAIQQIRGILNNLEEEISNSAPETVAEKESEELSEDDEIDKLLNDDPAGDDLW